MEYDLQLRDNLLFGFFRAGCAIARLCEKNIMYSDFHEGNVLVEESGKVFILDMDDVEFLDFPDEIEAYAKGIMNFYTHFDINFGAAFRFGFIHVAGEIGNILFNILYNDNDLTCLNLKNKSFQLNLDVAHLKTTYNDWKKLLEDSFIGNITKFNYEYDEYYFLDIMRKNSNEYRAFKDKYEQNLIIMRHEYQTYLANSLYSGNEFDLISAMLTLCQIEFFEENYILACYYFHAVRETLINNEKNERFEGHIKISMQVGYLFAQKFGIENINIIQQNIAFETFKLRLKEAWVNRYLEIWYWTDYAKEHSIDNLIEQKEYTCYQCNDCEFIDFYEKTNDICLRCNSKNLIEKTRDEYFHILACDHEEKGETTKDINLPKLDCVDMISIYIHAIDLYERRENYKKAIEVAHDIEYYLSSNSQIKDDNGYVLVKSSEAGKIFHDNYNPNQIMKLFHIDSEYVKSDYEALINYKLCKLYEKIDDYTSALQYANNLIDLSNNSLRWIENRFIEYSYKFFYEYERQHKNYNNALIYANVVFTYDLLRIIEKDSQEYIAMINSLGEDNAKAGNIALAYTCYLYSLRNHILHYGIRHPASAEIYSNIAQLYMMKRQHKDAFGYFAMAIKLLEISNNNKYEKIALSIETTLKDFLQQSQYPGSYDNWKNEWITDNTFDIFPEERFVKDNHEIHMSSSDELVTYDG